MPSAMAADDATEPALEDAFGTLLGPEDDEYFDPVEEKRQRREARFRAAVLHARGTYQAKVDSDAWFFEVADPDQPITDLAHREMDSKTTQKLGSWNSFVSISNDHRVFPRLSVLPWAVRRGIGRGLCTA